jgi:hypothetical protein
VLVETQNPTLRWNVARRVEGYGLPLGVNAGIGSTGSSKLARARIHGQHRAPERVLDGTRVLLRGPSMKRRTVVCDL